MICVMKLVMNKSKNVDFGFVMVGQIQGVGDGLVRCYEGVFCVFMDLKYIVIWIFILNFVCEFNC